MVLRIIGQLLAVSLVAFTCSPLSGGEFRISEQRYELENLNNTHNRLLISSKAEYVGRLDPNDHSYFLENYARVPAGNQVERTGNGLSGTGIMEGMEIECDVNCGPDVAVPKCNSLGYPTTYRGRTLVGIFHPFEPETESKLMDSGSTVCAHSCPDEGEDHQLPPDDPDDTIP